MLWLRHLTPFALLASLAAAGVLAYQNANQKLDEWLRAKLSEELAKENLRAEVGSLRLDPLRGLVARQCQLFGGPGGRLRLATFDELRVEADLPRLLQKEQFINSIVLSDATLSLPVNPEEDGTKWLTLSNVDAQIQASGDRFEIRRARGVFDGVVVTLEGSLLKPSRLPKGPPRAPGEKREALDVITKRRGFFSEIEKHLALFHFDKSAAPPRLNLRVEGDLDRPQDLRAAGHLRGEKIFYRDYLIEEADLSLEYARGALALRHARLRDADGTLQGHALLARNRENLRFSFDSSANLPALLGAMRDLPLLREFVLYEPGTLRIQGDGVLHFPPGSEGRAAILNLTGSASSGRFATRGAVFDSVSADFCLRGRDINVRELNLAHGTGALSGNFMRRDETWHYQMQMRMNPGALKPFITTDETLALFNQFSFEDSSAAAVEARGAGRLDDPASWRHHASVEAEQMRFRGDVIRLARGEIQRTNGRTTISQVRLVRPEGEITARQLTLDEAAHTLAIDGIQSAVFPAPIVRWFHPKVAEIIGWFQFARPPVVTMDGLLGTRNAEPNEFVIDAAADGAVTASIHGRALPLLNPGGRISMNGPTLVLDLAGAVRKGAVWEHTTLQDNVEGRFRGTFPIVPKSEAERTDAWQLHLAGPAKAEQTVGKARVPLEIDRAVIDLRQRRGQSEGPSVQVEGLGRIRNGARCFNLAALGDVDTHFQGVFDAGRHPDPGRNRWTLAVKAPNLVEYNVAGKQLPLQQLAFTLECRRNRLDISHVTARLYGGHVSSSGQIDHLDGVQEFSLAVQADDIAFGSLASLYSPGVQTAGQLTGSFRLTGAALSRNNPQIKWRGTGRMAVRDGDLFALPLLGPLSPLLDAMLPGTKTGYSKARSATATFSLSDNVLSTNDFEALATAFVIKGGGSVNFNSKRVNLNARVNTRGPTGMLLYPVSKLLEYEATGATSDPGWRPRVLAIPARLLPEGDDIRPR